MRWVEVFGRLERASKADWRSSGLEGVDLSLDGEAWMKAMSLTPAEMTALRSVGFGDGSILAREARYHLMRSVRRRVCSDSRIDLVDLIVGMIA